jgi:hypothetical protein
MQKLTKRELHAYIQEESTYCLEESQKWNQRLVEATQKVEYWKLQLDAIRTVSLRLDIEAVRVENLQRDKVTESKL